jgi:hypothetical protein
VVVSASQTVVYSTTATLNMIGNSEKSSFTLSIPPPGAAPRRALLLAVGIT